MYGNDWDWKFAGWCATTPSLMEYMKESGNDIFYDKELTEDGKKFCDGCPVQLMCHNYAMQNQMDGVWGGLSAKDRRQIHSRIRREIARFRARYSVQSQDDMSPTAS